MNAYQDLKSPVEQRPDRRVLQGDVELEVRVEVPVLVDEVEEGRLEEQLCKVEEELSLVPCSSSLCMRDVMLLLSLLMLVLQILLLSLLLVF